MRNRLWVILAIGVVWSESAAAQAIISSGPTTDVPIMADWAFVGRSLTLPSGTIEAAAGLVFQYEEPGIMRAFWMAMGLQASYGVSDDMELSLGTSLTLFETTKLDLGPGESLFDENDTEIKEGTDGPSWGNEFTLRGTHNLTKTLGFERVDFVLAWSIPLKFQGVADVAPTFQLSPEIRWRLGERLTLFAGNYLFSFGLVDGLSLAIPVQLGVGYQFSDSFAMRVDTTPFVLSIAHATQFDFGFDFYSENYAPVSVSAVLTNVGPLDIFAGVFVPRIFNPVWISAGAQARF